MDSTLLTSARDYLAQLVALPTPSAESNRRVVDLVISILDPLGWYVSVLPYRDAAQVEKRNVIFCSVSGPPPMEVELALVGHTDTVPADRTWRDAYKLVEENGKLYGRGACDTKGFIAAALAALARLEPAKLKRPLALVLTADEEVGCVGAKKLADAAAVKARYAIVGEPTSLRPVRAGKGYCLAEIVVKGREAHSAFPDMGWSAITAAARLITRLAATVEKLKTETDHAFDPPYTALNFGLINGGTAKNIVAGECRFTIEWRPVAGRPFRRALDLINETIERMKAEDEFFHAEVDVKRLDPGFATPHDARLVEFLEAWSGRPSGSVAFGTEAPLLTRLGAETVVFGPGNMQVAHRNYEYVPGNDLEFCAEGLLAAIREFCG